MPEDLEKEDVEPDPSSEGEGEEGKEEPKEKAPEDLQAQINNLNVALRQEREKRRQIEDEARQQVEQLKTAPIQEEKVEEPQFEDDDYLTFGAFKKIFDNQEEKRRKQEEAKSQAEMQYRIDLGIAESRFKEDHDDFDEITKIAQGELGKDPAMLSALFNDPKKAPERIYNYGKGLATRRLKEQERQDKTDAFLNPINGPATEGVRSSPKNAPARKDFENMTDAEFAREWEKLTPEQQMKLTGEM